MLTLEIGHCRLNPCLTFLLFVLASVAAAQVQETPPDEGAEDTPEEGEGQKEAVEFEPWEWHQTLIPPRQAADMFGRRIAKNYIAIQITVVNMHAELDLIVYDVDINTQNLDPACKIYSGEH